MRVPFSLGVNQVKPSKPQSVQGLCYELFWIQKELQVTDWDWGAYNMKGNNGANWRNFKKDRGSHSVGLD